LRRRREEERYVCMQTNESLKLCRSSFDKARVVDSNFFPSGKYRVVYVRGTGGTETESFLVDLKSLGVERIAS
jgi:hypothetical protein